jgi:cytosine deaminase
VGAAVTPIETDGPATLSLYGGTLRNGEQVDIHIQGAHLREINRHVAGSRPMLAAEPTRGVHPATEPDGRVTAVDISGCLVLPAPVEPHAHLDKALTADQFAGKPARAADLAHGLGAAVSTWLRHRRIVAEADLANRASRALQFYIDNGATAVRTHVDVDTDIGLRGLVAVAELRERYADLCELQIVAFAGGPVGRPTDDRPRALLREALAAGADVVGACPSTDPDPASCIAFCLDIAGQFQVGLDLHIDETLDPQPSALEMLADQVLATQFPFAVVASHCVSLGMLEPLRVAAIAERLACAGIGVICLPHTNLYLQGRSHPVATPRGLTALGVLRSAGVQVCAGGDNLQDPFNPLGRGDPLDVAALLVLAGHESPDAAYTAVSATGRAMLGLPAVEITAGAPAELLVIQAGSIREAIAEANPNRLVVHAGRVISRTTTERHRLPAAQPRLPAGRFPQ